MNAESTATGLPDFFRCSEMPDGSVRVRTPLTYPDGTLIDLFLIYRDDGTVAVSDNGDAIGWLGLQSAAGVTRDQNVKIVKVCRSLNVAKVGNRISAISQDRRTPGEQVAMVAQAAILISHIASG